MNAKEIARTADRIFQRALPASWAVRSQQDQEDYGVDYEIELMTPKDQATGFLFKVQQKGVQTAGWLANGETIAFSIETEKIVYYVRQLRIPILLVVVEIDSNASYWIPLHGNHHVMDRLAAAEQAGNSSLTLHIPSKNRLPETQKQFIAEVAQMMNFLTIERLKEMELPDVASVFAKDRDLDRTERSLRIAGSLVRSEKTQRLINDRQLKEAFEINRNAFVDEGETVEGRFHAAVQLVRVAGGLAVVQPELMSKANLIRIRLDAYQRLVGLTCRLPSDHALRHYGLFLARAARLRAFVDQDAGLFLARRAQLPSLDEISRVLMNDARRKARDRIVNELRRAQRRVATMLSMGMFGVAVYAWTELTEALGMFLVTLRHDKLDEGVSSIRRWLDAVGSVCIKVAELSGDAEMIGLVALNHVRVGMDTGATGERTQEASVLINAIADEEWRGTSLKLLDKLKGLSAQMSISGPDESLDELPESELEELIHHMARGQGVDLDDPNSPYARVLRIGIRDYNPGRVVRECEQIFVAIESFGTVAELVGLPTAGSKSVRCLKHGYKTSGMELDRVYGFFKESHCDSCPDRSPRAADWKWTHEWQRSEDERVFREDDERRKLAEVNPESRPSSATVSTRTLTMARPVSHDRDKQRADEAKRRSKRKQQRYDRKRQRRR